ncbi:hypothetical protein [Desulforhopalus sp. IMCC35007]|uniref:hypothetical protein n=1 Tax=Desulforhopalus sp. IMCC35007 TaxID=2569543 RepID=UPI0010AE7259|nr:hypothetical protein [Desulforhopalus sp. IMCC35007]TKB10885.1 hypothetical protein FCL48_06590 [Desulforhopalus sp. IMCC35007]
MRNHPPPVLRVEIEKPGGVASTIGWYSTTGAPAAVETVSDVPAEAKRGQRRPAVFEVECVA